MLIILSFVLLTVFIFRDLILASLIELYLIGVRLKKYLTSRCMFYKDLCICNNFVFNASSVSDIPSQFFEEPCFIMKNNKLYMVNPEKMTYYELIPGTEGELPFGYFKLD